MKTLPVNVKDYFRTCISVSEKSSLSQRRLSMVTDGALECNESYALYRRHMREHLKRKRVPVNFISNYIQTYIL